MGEKVTVESITEWVLMGFPAEPGQRTVLLKRIEELEANNKWLQERIDAALNVQRLDPHGVPDDDGLYLDATQMEAALQEEESD